MSEHCGSMTETGNALCVPGACSCSTESESKQPVSLPIVPEIKQDGLWKKMRSGVMFVIACVASPCCTPLIVPLGIALLAGTPIALWMSAHLGWIYGGLTLLSIGSFALGFLWTDKKHEVKHPIEISKKTADVARP